MQDKNYKVYLEDAFATVDFSQYLKAGKDSQTPAVRVKNVKFKNKKLALTITGFLVQKTSKEKAGRISVRIYITDNRENKILFHQGKTMLPQKDTVHISLSFQWLKKGSYEIGIHVNDLLTGKNAAKSIEAVVN